jgi:hypothetical protein
MHRWLLRRLPVAPDHHGPRFLPGERNRGFGSQGHLEVLIGSGGVVRYFEPLNFSQSRRPAVYELDLD